MKGSYPPLMSYVHGFTHLFSYCDGLIENSTWGPRRATILRFVSPVPQLRSWPIGSPVYWAPRRVPGRGRVFEAPRGSRSPISSRPRLLAAIEWGVRHVCLRDLRRDVPDVEARSLETIRTLPRAAAEDAVRQRYDLQIYLL